jgi:hypothetical protein
MKPLRLLLLALFAFVVNYMATPDACAQQPATDSYVMVIYYNSFHEFAKPYSFVLGKVNGSSISYNYSGTHYFASSGDRDAAAESAANYVGIPEFRSTSRYWASAYYTSEADAIDVALGAAWRMPQIGSPQHGSSQITCFTNVHYVAPLPITVTLSGSKEFDGNATPDGYTLTTSNADVTIKSDIVGDTSSPNPGVYVANGSGAQYISVAVRLEQGGQDVTRSLSD